MLAVAMLAASGCGDASTSTGSSTLAGSPASGASTVKASDVNPNATLNVAINTSLADLDPLTNSGDPYRNSVRLAMFDSLMAYDGATLKPSLAESYKSSDGAKSYVFNLRSNVKFSDGTPFTAKDVVYSFGRVADKKVGVYFADLLGDVKDVTAIGDTQVKVVLEKPSAGFLDALINMSIIKDASGDSNRKNPVGTGPFKFVKLVPNEKLELTRNTNYWKPKAFSAGLTYVPTTDPQVALQDLQGGNVNVLQDLDPTLLASAKSAPDVKVDVRPSTTMTYVDFFSKNLPSTDPRLRQAMAYCLDEQAVGDVAFSKSGTASQNILPQDSFAYADNVKDYPYDPAKAKGLLKAAGFPNGFSVTLDGLQGFGPQNKVLTLWQAGLKKCGIRAKTRVQEFNKWLDDFFKHKLQVSIDFDSQGLDPNRFYQISFVGPHAGGGDAVSKELLAVGAQANATLDQGQRAKLYQQYALLAAKDLHALPVYRSPTIFATAKDVVGVQVNPLGFYQYATAGVTK